MVSVSLRMVIALYWDDLQKSDEAASLGGLIYFAGRSKQPAAAKRLVFSSTLLHTKCQGWPRTPAACCRFVSF